MHHFEHEIGVYSIIHINIQITSLNRNIRLVQEIIIHNTINDKTMENIKLKEIADRQLPLQL